MNIPDAIHLVREACALRHFSFKTEKTYVYWLGRYGRFLKEQPPAQRATEQKLEAFLSRLAREGVSASTQNQAFNALLFFYREVLKQELGPVNSLRAKQPANPRHCPTQEETHRLLGAVTDIYGYPTRLIVHLLYGCGLRVTEPLNLRIKDVDLRVEALHLSVQRGNGRAVLFPGCLTGILEQQMIVAQEVAEKNAI